MKHKESCEVETGYGTADDVWRCAPDCTVKAEQAQQWRSEHLGNFVVAVIKCDDVQTLRALAHRLGYKEGT